MYVYICIYTYIYTLQEQKKNGHSYAFKIFAYNECKLIKEIKIYFYTFIMVSDTFIMVLYNFLENVDYHVHVKQFKKYLLFLCW